jgi:signal transduction histidine kinase
MQNSYLRKSNLHLLLWIFLFITTGVLYSNNNQKKYDEIIIAIKKQEFKNADFLIASSGIKNEEMLQLIQYSKIMNEFGTYKEFPMVRDCKILKLNSKYAQSLQFLNLGLYQLLYFFDKDAQAFINLKKALFIAKSTENKILKCEILKAIFLYYKKLINISDKEFTYFLLEYKKNNYDWFEKINYKITEVQLKVFNDTMYIETNSITQLLKNPAIKNNTYLEASAIKCLGLYYDLRLKKYQQARTYYQQAVNLFSKSNHGMSISGYYSTKICVGVADYYLKNYPKAIQEFKSIDTSYTGKIINWNNLYKYIWLANTYKELRQFDSAYYFLKKSHYVKNQLEQSKHDAIVSQIQIEYKTKEKELENLRLKTNIKSNRMLLYSFIFLLIILITISILGYKNIIKKKRIAEQDKRIKTQELEKVLKDQELNDIDLILESQEKERQNIANELHDNLGSMLATLKLNFQNLKQQKDKLNQREDKLYKKTDALLEEAYQNVRNIAHLKNLGVIGSEGLLVAVNNMAEKMSILEKLKINVIPFGLNERLENTIEVSLFRMIQELCTNIIKHSEATEVNIYLTQGTPTEINIIIEDNGKGFDPKIIVSQSGIGLKNMEKKVEQMGGTFTVDSVINKGTSIIIDLPL